MKPDENKLSNEASLRLIEQMISRARKEERDNGLGWVIWGWLLFLATMAHYILIKNKINAGNIVWNSFGIIAILFVLYELFVKTKPERKGKVKTYTNELVDRMGIAFFISLGIMVFGNYQSDTNYNGVNFGYLLLLYGFWMFIHGSAFRYKWLLAGAVFSWTGALVIFYFKEKLGAEVLLVHAICIVAGYLVPGHIAWKNFSKTNSLTGN